MNYPLLDIFFTTMWVFLWILWFFLLFRVIGDLFRDHSLGGWAKAGWCVFLIVLPFVGVLVYLIARGRSMSERDLQRSQEMEQQFQAYIRESAGTQGTGHAEELAKLADLRDHGDLSEEEYLKAKTKVLA